MSDNRKNRPGQRFLMGFGCLFSVSFREVEKIAGPGAGYGLEEQYHSPAMGWTGTIPHGGSTGGKIAWKKEK
ncbi:MAG: hypothetical protein NC331_10875 [Lachnospiraceae bacterium]|nr:hypothetical protein [Lachnospiraceae bacterium]MCM1239873.1 hypothetical protein [Lachnospiraceae bacterium]